MTIPITIIRSIRRHTTTVIDAHIPIIKIVIRKMTIPITIIRGLQHPVGMRGIKARVDFFARYFSGIGDAVAVGVRLRVRLGRGGGQHQSDRGDQHDRQAGQKRGLVMSGCRRRRRGSLGTHGAPCFLGRSCRGVGAHPSAKFRARSTWLLANEQRAVRR